MMVIFYIFVWVMSGIIPMQFTLDFMRRDPEGHRLLTDIMLDNLGNSRWIWIKFYMAVALMGPVILLSCLINRLFR